MKTKVILLVVALAGLVGVSMFLQRAEHPEDNQAKQETKKEAPKPKPVEDVVVTVQTSRGTFKFMTFGKDMPITCTNFMKLANRGFYTGLKFHRVEDWVVQGGDPKGDGTGGSDETIPLETAPNLGFDHNYTVGMARANDPNSASSQFFVIKKPSSFLNTQYAAFGQVFEGTNVIDKIKKGDVMKSVKVSKPTSAELNAFNKYLQKI